MASQCTSATPKQTPDAPLAKCVILGESGVGKSAIVKRLLSNRFDERVCATIVCSFQFKTLEVGEQQVRLQIWDTAGQERYRSVTPMFYRHAHCAVVVYDISDSRSFEQVPFWIEEARKYCQNPHLQLVLIGNKTDLDDRREISTEMAQSLAAKYAIPHFEVSAKIGGDNAMAPWHFLNLRRLFGVRLIPNTGRGAGGGA